MHEASVETYNDYWLVSPTLLAASSLVVDYHYIQSAEGIVSGLVMERLRPRMTHRVDVGSKTLDT